MKAVAGTLPTGDGWAFELKWDGMRLHASIADEVVELRSGSGRVVTSSFPELEPLGRHLGIDAVLDGEVVVFDADRPSFSRLQQRMHTLQPSAALLKAHPTVFLIFDVLHIDGQETIALPYLDRRRLLTGLIDQEPGWQVPPHAEANGEALLDLARARNLEGIVAKRVSSAYRPDTRSPSWIKIKIRRRQEFVIGGWLPGTGSLEGSLGSILVGVNGPDGFTFAGAVGSGLTDPERAKLLSLVKTTADCPFESTPGLAKKPTWVDPKIVIEVSFAEWEVGHHLRHPSYDGIRADKDPDTVLRDIFS